MAEEEICEIYGLTGCKTFKSNREAKDFLDTLPYADTSYTVLSDKDSDKTFAAWITGKDVKGRKFEGINACLRDGAEDFKERTEKIVYDVIFYNLTSKRVAFLESIFNISAVNEMTAIVKAVNHSTHINNTDIFFNIIFY